MTRSPMDKCSNVSLDRDGPVNQIVITAQSFFIFGIIYQQMVPLKKKSQQRMHLEKWTIACTQYYVFGGLKEWEDEDHDYNVLASEDMTDEIVHEVIRLIKGFAKEFKL